MYVILASMKIKEGHKEAFVEALLEDAQASVRDEADCFRFDVIRFEEREVSVELTFDELMGNPALELAKGRAVFDYAGALHTLQGTDNGETVSIEDAFASLQAAEELLPGDAELAEIRSILEAL